MGKRERNTLRLPIEGSNYYPKPKGARKSTAYRVRAEAAGVGAMGRRIQPEPIHSLGHMDQGE